MLTRLFTRLPVRQVAQTRNGSGFNKYPVFKLKHYGYSGNTYLIIGAVSLVFTTWLAQTTGSLFPSQLPGWGGLFSVKGIPMDLTPDELLERRKNEE